MNNSQNIIDILDYIENNLTEPLTVEKLSKKAGYSPFYLSRLFTLYTGMSSMEYIRRRRLAHAVYDICEGKKLIDVALDYGFETHNGFSKAFKKVYGYSPYEYKNRVGTHRPLPSNPLENVELAVPDISPEINIVTEEGFYLAGMVVRSSDVLSSIAQVPALWEKYRLDEQEHKIYAIARPHQHGEYYVSFPAQGDLFHLVTGVKIDDPEDIENDLYVNWVPPATYAVFTLPVVFGDQSKFAAAIVDMWKYIYEIWLPNSEYDYDSSGLEYEFYDERCHGDGPYSMEIHIPIIKK